MDCWKVVGLIPIRWPPLSDVRKEDVLDDVASASSTLLTDAEKDAMSIVLVEMKCVCAVYDVDFQVLSEAHENVACESLEEM